MTSIHQDIRIAMLYIFMSEVAKPVVEDWNDLTLTDKVPLSKDTPMHEDHILNDLWSFYFHDPFNNDWNLSSYVKVADIGSVETFWQIHETFIEKITMAMFFLTREHIFPCWDDPFNKDGGCLSIKVLKQDVPPFWEIMCAHILGETLLVNDKHTMWDHVNGLSISPKKHFCIIKVWMRTNEVQDVADYNIPPGYYGEMIYKPNRDNIEGQSHQLGPIAATIASLNSNSNSNNNNAHH